MVLCLLLSRFLCDLTEVFVERIALQICFRKICSIWHVRLLRFYLRLEVMKAQSSKWYVSNPRSCSVVQIRVVKTCIILQIRSCSASTVQTSCRAWRCFSSVHANIFQHWNTTRTQNNKIHFNFKVPQCMNTGPAVLRSYMVAVYNPLAVLASYFPNLTATSLSTSCC